MSKDADKIDIDVENIMLVGSIAAAVVVITGLFALLCVFDLLFNNPEGL